MPKVKALTDQDDKHSGWMIYCQGCKCGHLFDQRWTFNGDVERPTFRASMLVNATLHLTHPHMPRCHSFVTDGRIEFLGDCSHSMAGQTVELQDMD